MSSLAAVAASRSLCMHQTVASFRSARKALHPSIRVGFVPTMGALHEGHLSLVRHAREMNDVVVASIFVNPTQFDDGEDFDKYPRRLEQDSELLSDMGVDHLFTPDRAAMYGTNHMTYVEAQGFDDIPEGVARPGHFRGVATIVTKLFNIVQPTNAYFGQKDAAQCSLIARIVQDLDMDVNVVVMDTVREPNGLAMSSRNAHLSTAEREASSVIHRSLCAARDLWNRSVTAPIARGTVPAQELVKIVVNMLQQEPLVSEIQYVAVDDKATMKPKHQVGPEGAIVSLACKVGSVRLIDNVFL